MSDDERPDIDFARAAWQELEADWARRVPRLDPKSSHRCAVCRQPGSEPFQWRLGTTTAWYIWCRPCGTVWYLGENAFVDYSLHDDDDVEDDGLSPEELERIRNDFLYASLLEIARATRVEPLLLELLLPCRLDLRVELGIGFFKIRES